jgi:uncharacterized membrane protein
MPEPHAGHDHGHRHGHSHSHGHRHGHSHSHGRRDRGGWEAWRDQPLLLGVLVLLAVAFVATVIGLVVLWPDGDGLQTAQDDAAELGLASDRFRAEVVEVTEAVCSYAGGDPDVLCRSVVVVPSEGPDAGALVSLGEFDLTDPRFAPNVSVGDDVVVGYESQTGFYFYADQERRGPLLWLALIFAAAVIALGRFRGVLALLASASTVVVLVVFIAPAVLDGRDPLLVCLVGAAAIAFVSLYLTHGINPMTTVALAGTLGALGLTLVLSIVFFELADFTGLATEEGLTLPAVVGELDLLGLLLGGVMLGTLGALDDVTVTQSATVWELHETDRRLGFVRLFRSGMSVGREHIASTVNTLLLAYAGASLPLVLLFALSDQSLATVANSEIVAVEIARTLCGSIGLVAATPLTTGLAAAALTLGPRRRGADEAPASADAAGRSSDRGPHQEEPAESSWEDFAPRSTLDF